MARIRLQLSALVWCGYAGVFAFRICSSSQRRVVHRTYAAAVRRMAPVQSQDRSLPGIRGAANQILTEAPGLPAAEVESFITVPLEEMLSGIPWVRSMQSRSAAGVSSIVLHLEADADIMNARQMTQERLNHAIALPKVSKPPTMLQLVSSQNRSNIVGLSSSSMPLIEMSVLARWKVKPRLLGVPGVANVSIWASAPGSCRFWSTRSGSRQSDVSLSDVIKATGDLVWSSPLTFLQASTPGNGGFYRHAKSALRYSPRAAHFFGRGSRQGQLPFNQGPALQPGRRGHRRRGASAVDRRCGGRRQDRTDDCHREISRRRYGRSHARYRRAFAALAPALPGVDIDTSLYRPTSYIENVAVQSRQDRLDRFVSGGRVFVPVHLRLAPHGGRGAIGRSCHVERAFRPSGRRRGGEFHDDRGPRHGIGIFNQRNAVHHFFLGASRPGRRSSPQVGRFACGRDAAAAKFESRSLALICVVAAGATLLLLTDMVAVLWKQTIIAFLVGIVMSYLVSLFIVPSLVLISGLATHGGSQKKSALASVELWLARMVHWSFGGGRAMLLLAGLASLIVLATIYLLPKDLVPDFQERSFVIRLDTAPGVSLARMRQDVDKLTNAVKDVPGITTVAAQMGRAELSDRLSDVNIAELWLGMDSSVDVEETLTAVGETIAKNIDPSRQRVVVDSYSAMKIAENVAIIRAPVEVRLNGPGGNQLDQAYRRHLDVARLDTGAGRAPHCRTSG